MANPVTASEARANLYRLIDETNESHRPVVIAGERCQQPGASVSAIALENGINANVVFRWRREHLRATSGVAQHGAAQAVLLPVKLAAATPSEPASMSSRSPMPTGVIEIDIGAARVRLRGAVDEATLRCVLQTLKAGA